MTYVLQTASSLSALLLVVLLVLFSYTGSAYKMDDVKRRSMGDGPPVRPSSFRSAAELDQFLSELSDYYSLLGRPRFGKRSWGDMPDYSMLGHDNFKRALPAYEMKILKYLKSHAR